jgi:hypothetical protein
VNRNNIETVAVSAVKLALSQVDCLDPAYINERDKEPCWDGRILVTGVDGKDDIKVAYTQVKGITCKSSELIKQEIKYDKVEVSDLKNYMSNGGVVFFVVGINGPKNRVFYNCLLPVKIKLLLADVGDQKTTTITLKHLPDDVTRIAEIFTNFVKDSHKQASFSDKPLIHLDNRLDHRITNLQFTFTGFASSPDDALFHIFGHEVYTYALFDGLPYPIPTDAYGTVHEIQSSRSRDISIGDVKYYSTQDIVTTENEIIIRFGKSFELVLSRNAPTLKGTININMSGNLNERITDLRFLEALRVSKNFTIGSVKIPIFDFSDDIATSLAPTEKLQFFSDLRNLLDYFKIDDNICIDDIEVDELKHIAWLHDGIIKKFPREHLNLSDPYMLVRNHILSCTIMLFANRIAENTYMIDDFCKGESICVYGGDSDSKFVTSRFVLFEVEDYAKVVNLNFDDVVKSITDVEPTVRHCENANNMALRMLQAYDLEGRLECLEAALSVFSWLSETGKDALDDKISTINILQTIIRSRDLNKDEEGVLKNLIRDEALLSDDERGITVAALILLQDFTKAQALFDKLTREKQETIVGYPLETLWKSRIAENATMAKVASTSMPKTIERSLS